MSVPTPAQPVPAPEALISVAWWRLLLERVGRQAAQTAVPILVATTSTTGRVDVAAAGIALAGALALTVVTSLLREVAAVTPDPSGPLWVQLVDRAVPAAAGVLVGFVPVSASGLMAVDWASAGWAALAAAALAILSVYVTPPALAQVAARGGAA